jgi:hypothetical protein
MAATHSANPGGAGNTAPSIDPSRFESGYLRANGLRFHAVSCGPRDGTKVLLLHGFPEFWYSWRHQLIALADAGYRAIAPDLRGYNLSDKPQGVMNYDVPILLEDIVGLAPEPVCGAASSVTHPGRDPGPAAVGGTGHGAWQRAGLQPARPRQQPAYPVPV